MNWFNQAPHLAMTITWESDKYTRKHYTQESQEVSLFPTRVHKDTRNRQDSMTKTNTKHKSTNEAMPSNLSKKITGGLKHVCLSLISGVVNSFSGSITIKLYILNVCWI